jgi:glyoxylase-like metal-dependent hydrolase (beta-lactamase superfamily II)
MASRLALALAGVAMAGAVGVRAFQAPPGSGIARIQLITLELYEVIGGGPNTFIYQRDDGVILVDPRTAGSGMTMKKIVGAMTDKPITTLVLTNGNDDHAGATGEFADARIIASDSTARRLKSAGLAKPVTVVNDKLSLFEKTLRVDVYYFGKGITDGDLVVGFPDAGVVHLGDLFPKKAAPMIDVAHGGSGVALPDTLAKIVAGLKGFRRVGAGRDAPARSAGAGELIPWRDLEDYAEFNRVFLEKTRQAIADGLTADQAAAKLEMPEKFKAYDMQQAAANVAAIYHELGH